MLLSEVFNYLTYGELGQLSVGGLEDGGIRSKDYPRIINSINLGLIELYKEFPLKTREIFVQMYDHIATYTLHTDYAVSNLTSTQPYKYIIDTANEPFTNDVLVIDGVFNEEGEEYPLNDSNQTWSVFTPSYNSIQVPFADGNNALSVIYRASPTKLDPINSDPSVTDVPIPDSLLEPLISYVVSKAFASVGGGSNNEAGLYYNKFKASLNDIKSAGILNRENYFNERLWRNGWV